LEKLFLRRNIMAISCPSVAPSIQEFSDATADAGRNVGNEAKSLAAHIAEKAETTTEAVGACMESLGESLCKHSPKEGVLASAGHAIGEKFESSGRYLEKKGLKGIGDDMTNLIRSNPVPALLVGIGVGFLFAKLMRS
jgi:hypothetical protein